MKKEDYFNYFKQCFRMGLFLYAIRVFILVPKNRKGFEVFNELITIKIYNKLYKRFHSLLGDSVIYEKQNIPKNKVIWFCWLQGEENAPLLVKKVFASIKKYNPEYSIVFITEQNFEKYTNIPVYIKEKWKKGIISNTHFSDILRTNLLILNGGTWIDSTALMTGHIPEEIENSDLFFFRTFKPGSLGKRCNLSNWFISAKAGNEVLVDIQKLLYEYWKKNNYVCNYFFYHMFAEMCLEKYSNLEMPVYSNENPHFMFYELGNDFSKERWSCLKNKSFVHKLSNKIDVKNYSEQSIYNHIIGDLVDE